MYNLRTLIIENMYNLRTLIIECGPSFYYKNDIEVYLCMKDLDYLPDKLRYLHLESSLLEIHSSRECPKLKQLYLTSCAKLIRIPDLSDIPSAESINLEYCSSLLEIHSSRECPKLKLLYLPSCEKLIRIPDLSDIPSVESINLKSCSSLLEIHSSRDCPKLKQLYLTSCEKLIRIPDLSDIPSVESINLKSCNSLLEIHSSRDCPKLKQLYLTSCEKLIRIPDLSDIPSAESINLEYYSSLLEIHSSRECPKLKQLYLTSCAKLIRIPDLSDIPSANSINLEYCSSLIEIHSSRECPKLKWLNLDSCKNLVSIPDLSNIPSAEIINLNYCSSLLEIQSSRECPKLKQLYLTSCEKLIRIPDLSDIPSAESINLEYCSSLLEIHSSREYPKLKQLYLTSCEKLIRIPDLSDIPSVESINLKSCSSLLEIHSSRECPKLKQLYLTSCEKLIRIPDLSDIPSAESIDLESCRSLLEIHSSRECPKNLHSLHLFRCESLSRLPSNIHIEGSEFSLFNCMSLTNFPHISGNIKRLEMRGSGVEEVPSMIQSLSMLERLDMSYCTRLKSISKSICKLKSLNLLDLTGCCKLEKLPPFSGLCSLKELRLNNSNLTEISEDIGCLSSLEKLELHGNVFERLPKSIKQLSKLYYLSLYNCGMLRSLPELPSSLRYLEAMNCKELIQSLPDESEIELCADGGGSFIFSFMNCLKLNQKAVRNLFRDSLLKMQLMGTEKTISLFGQYEEEVEGIICLPGSEIPEWFSYKNPGSSINIRELRNDCGRSSYIMGFARINWLGTHLILGYNLSPKCYQFFQSLDTQIANRGMSDYVDTSFEFNIGHCNWWAYDKIAPVKGCEVKYCGIEPIYVQAHVMNSVSINQDIGDTSGRNDIAEETCEPHPKRICTEANQCSTTHGF
ncbi:hypothetical protein EZV62_026298 [Acer yangbiense]|uniref:C-JID domain-containing protein n=1 Tax=Acer yangbiense TaxID=1000413 RepID=A0A5C7GQE0_9ROSI|nr:hypothetical protein EZV62_026298 [Acer yangbiense]